MTYFFVYFSRQKENFLLFSIINQILKKFIILIRNKRGETPLHLAAGAKLRPGCPNHVQILLDYKATLGIIYSSPKPGCRW